MSSWRQRLGDGWNPWVVKFLHQLSHNYFAVIFGTLLLLFQVIVFTCVDHPFTLGGYAENRLPQWLWWLFGIAGFDSCFCVVSSFGGFVKRRSGVNDHYLSFAPLAAAKVCSGIVCAYGLSFLGALGLMIPTLAGCFLFLFPQCGEIGMGLAYAFFLGFFLTLAVLCRTLSLELILFGVVGFMLPGEKQLVPEMVLTILLLITLYSYGILYFSLTPPEAQDAWGLRGLLMLFGVFYWLLAPQYPDATINSLMILALSAGAISSLGSTADGLGRRKLAWFPERWWGRWGRFLLPASSLGSLWWYLPAGVALVWFSCKVERGVLQALLITWLSSGIIALGIVKRFLPYRMIQGNPGVQTTALSLLLCGGGWILVGLWLFIIEKPLTKPYETGITWTFLVAAVMTLLWLLPEVWRDGKRCGVWGKR